MAIKYSFIMDDADVKKGITSVGTRSKSIRKDMHCLAVSILKNWAKSGAVNVACERANQMLVECDPAYAQKIVNWFTLYAGFTFADKKLSYTETKISVETVQKAQSETMFDLTKDAAPKAVDMVAGLKREIAKAKKAIANGLSDKDNVPEGMVEAAEKLLDTFDK